MGAKITLMGEKSSRYEDEVNAVRRTCQAEAAVLIVLNGNKGNGCALSVPPDSPLREQLPRILRSFAGSVEQVNIAIARAKRQH